MRYALLLLTATLAAQDFRPLFNGKNLDEFIVDTPGLWRVENGVLIGKHDGLKYNDFLRTRRHYRNFILKFEFRLLNGEGNSGVQFRSKPVTDSHEVAGYQADIGQQYWGCLYDESRRKRILAQAPPETLAGLDKSGWNTYTLEVRGPRIQLFLNGRRTVDYTETEAGIDESGFLAFQVHSGPPIEIHFRKIEIADIN